MLTQRHHPVQRLPSVPTEEILAKLQDVQDTMDESGKTLYSELFSDLLDIFQKFNRKNSTVSFEVYETILDIFNSIQLAVEQQHSTKNPVQRLSCSRASNSLLDFFRKKIDHLLNILKAPKENHTVIEERWIELRKLKSERFISELESTLVSLDPTQKGDLMPLLVRELQSYNYVKGQRQFLQKTYDELCAEGRSGTVNNSLPEWFIGSD
ncbi:Mitogen-activated protein kinase kinase kinase mlk-1 [Phytophthora boehmeriae]|uniref:Mitogen-activated protein kinase kinase kinase mlk-1 n=1 Tax=Phytophthora boehmeriae TaxID=109152 RepID=A0A8T1V3V6_9STRA|nr:Mitogen-activated protein kinase kinase kinase mlk-1 [Phytophthora boehmeriae]